MALTKATNRMISGAVANVLDFGADPTGTNDSASAIQAAINSVSSGGVVYLPAGTYDIATGLTLSDNYVKLSGDGWFATKVIATADVVPFTVTGNYCELTKFHLSKTGSHTKSGIVVGAAGNFADRFRCREVFIDGMGNHGFEVIASALLYVEDLTTILCGADGFHVSNVDEINVNMNSGGVIDTRGNTRHGFYIQGETPNESASHMFGTIVSQSNGGDGIKLECRSSNFNAIYTENNSGAGLNLTSYANGNKCHIINGAITDNGQGNVIFHEDVESERAGFQFIEMSGTATGGWKVNTGAGTYTGSTTFRHTANSEFTLNAESSGTDFTLKLRNDAAGKVYNMDVEGNVRAQDGFKLTASSDVKIIHGTGSPESVYTAAVGSLFLRTDGGSGTTLYVKESGTGNTGWAAV
jgi:hypothetical protein